jgi:hypothetical protein
LMADASDFPDFSIEFATSLHCLCSIPELAFLVWPLADLLVHGIQSLPTLSCLSTCLEARFIPIESPNQKDNHKPAHQSKNHPPPGRARSIYNVKQDFLIHQSTIAPTGIGE